MTLVFEQTAQDYIAFNYYYHWTSPAKKWARVRIRLLPLAFFLLLVLPGVFSKGTITGADIALLLFGALFALLLTPYMKWLTGMRVNKIIKSGKNSDLIGPRRIDFESERVKLSTAHAESAVQWASLEKLEETDGHLFLFVTVNQALIIPKHIFESEAALAEVKGVIQEKLQLLTPDQSR